MKTAEQRHKEIVDAIEQAESDMEKEQPEPKDMFGYYQQALTEVGHAIVPRDILHEFFNSRSDANKYLDATEQEELEKEFHDYLRST